MNSRSSLVTSIGCVLFIVNSIVAAKAVAGDQGLVGNLLQGASSGASQCVGATNDVTKKITGSASQQSSGLLNGVVGQNGLVGGLLGSDGGLLDGVLGGNDGLLGGLLGGGSGAASQCVETTKNTTGSVTNMTCQQSTCSLISLQVIVSYVKQKCDKCKSADECMSLVCDTECKQTCQTALIKIIIEVLLDLRTLGRLTTSMAGASANEKPFMQSLVQLCLNLGISLPIKK